MEYAKDTFYIAMRTRLATLNPERTMLLRAVQRPGILVEEAEAATAQIAADVFVLRWTGLKTDSELPSALYSMDCEVHYTTAGTATNAGLDRGRALAEMDKELLSILQPSWAQNMNYALTPAAVLGTRVFWTPPVFSEAIVLRERLTRVAKVTVFAFEEQGAA
jgi:hypothetical protein